MRDGAIVNAQTLNSSDGGNITININTSSGSDPSFFERFERFGRDVVNNKGSASGLFASVAPTLGAGHLQFAQEV
ncbi:hypothetical protein [Gloeocapsopsis dulcis]|uniref:Filamentous haemagglutinin FhaB/tRNA nuclease CdiA-like TPS domain-containing protein n=1 Tax=Gloeocapsopsis dulcis AAB1 = 1H9 TaxID=1433147 RepID=A0A6N8FRF4_9CHRO|nr:hypothetical protein [Gloeocapsopsis dulcis]MUL34925.1 hypothetical protein [Gloeocapsopsis dulcis AAB1 = 1H9]WNN90003.1 hypothetical protein P0S91_02575 [Gloeocapsopsis dulcis]